MAEKPIAQICRDLLELAVIEYFNMVDSYQCHVHLRIDAEGKAYVSEDAGYSVSEAEYNREPGHVRTVKHQQGHGQFHLEEDWELTDDGMESVRTMIDAIVEDLEREGLEIVWVES